MGHQMMAFLLLFKLSVQATVSCENAWEAKWQKVKLSPAQIDAANTILPQMIQSPNIQKIHIDALNNAFDGKPLDTSHYNVHKDLSWKPVDPNAKRYRQLCRMFYWQTGLNPKSQLWDNWKGRSTCSCAFLEPSIAVLAAHCFRSKEINPATWNVGYLVLQYGNYDGDETKFAGHLTENARIITEWWYPDGFVAPGTDAKPTKPWDVAFVKIESPIPGLTKETDFYTMELPWTGTGKPPNDYSIEGKKLIALGYPSDYKVGEVAVDFKGVCDATRATNDKRRFLTIEGKAARLGNDRKPGDKPVAKKDKKVVDKSMSSGGSGGPWILDEDELKVFRDPLKEKLSMAIFSVSGVGCELKDKCKYMNGAVFTPRLLEAAAKIRAMMKPALIRRGGQQPAQSLVELKLAVTGPDNNLYVSLHVSPPK